MIASLVEALVPLVRKPLALVGTPVAFVGDALTRVGKRFAPVGEAVSFISAMLLLAQLGPRLIDARSVRVRTELAGLTRRFLTNGRIPTILSLVHSFSMRLAGSRLSKSIPS